MGRAVMYAIIAVLGIFVLTATFLINGGGQSTATVNFITVLDLATNSSLYDDREVETRGDLEYDEDIDTYYVVEGNERLRVSYEPGGIDQYVGQEVRVIGQLEYDDDGVYIEADRVRPLEV